MPLASLRKSALAADGAGFLLTPEMEFRKEIRVFSVIGPAVEVPVVAKFQRNGFFTQPGQAVVVTGDVPELGDWDLRRAPRLKVVNADTWFNEIPFEASAGQPICFRFVVI
jgi:cyclomaltodextrin glucanotransferase